MAFIFKMQICHVYNNVFSNPHLGYIVMKAPNDFSHAG